MFNQVYVLKGFNQIFAGRLLGTREDSDKCVFVSVGINSCRCGDKCMNVGGVACSRTWSCGNICRCGNKCMNVGGGACIRCPW